MDDQEGRRRRFIILISAVFLAALIAVATLSAIAAHFYGLDPMTWVEDLEILILSWGQWSILMSIGLMVLHSFIPFPAEFLAIANGMLFGPIWGTVITWIGAMLGAILAFGLSRLLGRPFVKIVLARKQLTELDKWSNDQAAHWVFLARFVPVIAFNLVNYAAGLTGISWWTFIWTTAIGILPMSALMVTMGASVHQLDWHWWLALMAFGILAWLLLRRWITRNQGVS
jgi:uncharacterized membrane protein YdjX (TVP38/TMEM64 family)